MLVVYDGYIFRCLIKFVTLLNYRYYKLYKIDNIPN